MPPLGLRNVNVRENSTAFLPSDCLTFHALLNLVNDELISTGHGTHKYEAKGDAARQALAILRQRG